MSVRKASEFVSENFAAVYGDDVNDYIQKRKKWTQPKYNLYELLDRLEQENTKFEEILGNMEGLEDKQDEVIGELGKIEMKLNKLALEAKTRHFEEEEEEYQPAGQPPEAPPPPAPFVSRQAIKIEKQANRAAQIAQKTGDIFDQMRQAMDLRRSRIQPKEEREEPEPAMASAQMQVQAAVKLPSRGGYVCSYCGVKKATKRCPCKTVFYCSIECQEKHWEVHMNDCID
jgi:DNA repair exonuclease SbcCD ATPase subunit